MMDDWMIVSGDLIWLFRHEDVYDKSCDLSDDLDLLFLEEYSIWLLESDLGAKLLQIFDY